MPTNDFLPYAVGSTANVEAQAAYAAETTLLANGLVSGIVPSQKLNKTMRQSSIMSAVLAQFIANNSGANSVDDGTTTTLISNLQKALSVFNVGTDTGSINAYAIALNPPIAAYIPGLIINLQGLLNTNTGTSTIAINGLAAIPIVGPAGAALQGGELIATYGALLRINKLSTAAELVYTSGGSQPVANATKSNQAVNLGQAGGLYTPIAFVQQGAISAAITLTTAQSGTSFYVAAGTVNYNVTLPALFSGMQYKFFGVGSSFTVNLVIPASVGGSLYLPDGTTQPISAGLTYTARNLSELGSEFDIISDGYSIFVINTSGRVITKNAVASNEAVNLGQFAATLAGNGYQKLPGGLIIQWGSLAQTSGVEGAVVITFPIAFPTACLQAIPGLDGGTWNTITAFNFSGQTLGLSATSFKYYFQFQNTTVGAGTYYLTYVAIGY